ncbi:MAG: ArsR/SmtB family transcription factor [Methermicoccaceae archaeon]
MCRIERLKAEIFKSLAHPTRIRILELLRDASTTGYCELGEKCGGERRGELCVCKITPALRIEQSNASQHLAHLKQRGLIRGRREGKSVYYSVTNPKVFELLELVGELLEEQLKENQDALEMMR